MAKVRHAERLTTAEALIWHRQKEDLERKRLEIEAFSQQIAGAHDLLESMKREREQYAATSRSAILDGHLRAIEGASLGAAIEQGAEGVAVVWHEEVTDPPVVKPCERCGKTSDGYMCCAACAAKGDEKASEPSIHGPRLGVVEKTTSEDEPGIVAFCSRPVNKIVDVAPPDVAPPVLPPGFTEVALVGKREPACHRAPAPVSS